jgi:hypothetical protein
VAWRDEEAPIADVARANTPAAKIANELRANRVVIVTVVFSGVSTSRTSTEVVGSSSFGGPHPSSNSSERGGSTEMMRRHPWSFSPSSPVRYDPPRHRR